MIEKDELEIREKSLHQKSLNAKLRIQDSLAAFLKFENMLNDHKYSHVVDQDQTYVKTGYFLTRY